MNPDTGTREEGAAEVLHRAAEAVADGRAVDWSTVHSDDPAVASQLEDLRAIEAMARALQREPRVRPIEGLAAGTRISTFRVVRQAESGGMGVVYEAFDEVLGRSVALKSLPSNVRHSPERLARLRLEARLLASLSHTNIATIFGMEATDAGEQYLVMEWLPGGSLSARLRQGALPLPEALDVGAQVAEGVAAAHEAGVIHRDLKPANVMFSASGRVKVVDFGIARRGASGEIAANDAEAPLVAGTWGYASPERYRGVEDHRTDAFGFGCVLYECLTGTPAFGGETLEDIHEAVLHRDPDLGRLPAECPEPVTRLLSACLEKEPSKRLDSMTEAMRVLQTALGRARARAVPRGNLPPVTTTFVGRVDDLARLRPALQGGRLLTLTGPAGAGKTRMALALVRGAPPRTDGKWFVDFALVTEGARAVEAVAAILGVAEDREIPLLSRIVERLSGLEAILLFDNCEHVAGVCASMAEAILRSCPEVTLVATSRIALHVDGEQAVPVQPLPVPQAGDLRDEDAAGHFDSVRLFLERAVEADPAFTVHSVDLAAVAEICRKVEGLPLAIELAAARVRVLGVPEIAARLDRQLQLLRDPSGKRGARHRALEGAISWSVELLTPRETKVFQALAIFVGGWDLEAATFLCEAADEFETLDWMSSLIDKSLVLVAPGKLGASRYRFLEPVRQFARQWLERSPEFGAVQHRHRTYFVQLAESSEPQLYAVEQGRWLDRLAEDHANLLAALEGSYADPEGAEPGLRLVGALGRYWHVRGHVELGDTQISRMLEHPGALEPSTLRARALVMAGALTLWRGDFERAGAVLEEALAYYRANGDRAGEGRVLLSLGAVATTQGDADGAWSAYDQALDVYRAMDNPRGVATILGNMGVVAYARGDLEEAYRLYGDAIGLHRRSGDKVTLALALGNRSGLSVQRGDPQAARAEVREALQLSLELDAMWAGVSALAAVGALCLAQGEPETAAWTLGAATGCLEASGLCLSREQSRQMDGLANQAREVLGETRFDEAWRSGTSLSFRDAGDRVLAWLDADGPRAPVF